MPQSCMPDAQITSCHPIVLLSFSFLHTVQRSIEFMLNRRWRLALTTPLTALHHKLQVLHHPVSAGEIVNLSLSLVFVDQQLNHSSPASPPYPTHPSTAPYPQSSLVREEDLKELHDINKYVSEQCNMAQPYSNTTVSPSLYTCLQFVSTIPKYKLSIE